MASNSSRTQPHSSLRRRYYRDSSLVFPRREWLRYLERHSPQDSEPSRWRARFPWRQLLHKPPRGTWGAGNTWVIKPNSEDMTFLWWKIRISMPDMLCSLLDLLTFEIPLHLIVWKKIYIYRVTHDLDSYIRLQSIWGVPHVCLGSS